MATKIFTSADTDWNGPGVFWNTGVEAQNACGYRTITVKGTFGGNKILLYTINEGIRTQVPDFSPMDQNDVDTFGDSLTQRNFSSSGEIVVHLGGGTSAPNVIVTIS